MNIEEKASYCLNCKVKPCSKKGCPLENDIPAFIKEIKENHFDKAYEILSQTTVLQGVCGRICPHEKQCQGSCVRGIKGESVSIGELEAYTFDLEKDNKESLLRCYEKEEKLNLNKKVAVIGGGPSGLTCAAFLARKGIDVTIYEKYDYLGGLLVHGIPEFRLPNSIVDYEIDGLKALGVKFEKDVIIGKTLTYDDLHKMGFKGVFVASGAGLPRFMNIPGENLNGVMSSNEYLTRINLMGAGSEGWDTPVLRGKRIAVIGGGNTAMDSVRTARRMGAEHAILVYRRSEEEMPARLEEVKHAKEEGVEFMTLHNPIEYIGDESGRVKLMRLQKMELGEPDASGRRSPVPIEGAIEEVPVDLVIVSVGVSPNPLVPRSIEGLEVSKRNTIVVDEDTMKSSLNDVYAGGDIVRGGATVILAMGDGRKAAQHMHEALSSK